MKRIKGQLYFLHSYPPFNNWSQYNDAIKNETYFLTSRGKDSLKLIIKMLKLTKDEEVLLPPYLCKEVLEPFKDENIRIRFYRININLIADLNDIEKKIAKKTRALLIIHYFGYPQPIKEIRKICDKNSLYLIEDIVQAFLSSYDGKFLGQLGDFSFNSFRKFLPVSDGSLFLVNNKNINTDVSLKNNSLLDAIYGYLCYAGKKLKNLYQKIPLMPRSLFLRMLYRASELLSVQHSEPIEMSQLSKKIIEKTDFNKIYYKRRENFQYLLDNLKSNKLIKPFYNKLSPGICPFGFPVRTENRELIKNELIKNKIYPSIHWELPRDIDKKEFTISWKISRNLLTIPINQKYGKRQMDQIINCLKEQEHKYRKEL